MSRDVFSSIRAVKNSWDTLTPAEQAAEVTELECRVRGVAEKKIIRQVERLRFQGAFPLVVEVESIRSRSFAGGVAKVARRVLQTGSSKPFEELNPRQQQETMRYAREGA